MGLLFWSSAVLTGNRTRTKDGSLKPKFWSSAVLTGNRTASSSIGDLPRFGAVPF
mgnify:CR=1